MLNLFDVIWKFLSYCESTHGLHLVTKDGKPYNRAHLLDEYIGYLWRFHAGSNHYDLTK